MPKSLQCASLSRLSSCAMHTCASSISLAREALDVKRLEVTEQFLELVARVETRLLHLAQFLEQLNTLCKCDAIPFLDNADALLNVHETARQLHLFVLGAIARKLWLALASTSSCTSFVCTRRARAPPCAPL